MSTFLGLDTVFPKTGRYARNSSHFSLIITYNELQAAKKTVIYGYWTHGS